MRENTAREQEKDQDALKEYKEKYRILTEMMPLGAFRLGPGPDYRVVSANRMLSEMLGFDSADVMEEFRYGISCWTPPTGSRLKLIWLRMGRLHSVNCSLSKRKVLGFMWHSMPGLYLILISLLHGLMLLLKM
jgi:PAS domain-containing protein